MSRLVSWEDYQNVRRKLAEYSKFLIYHEPKEDLSNDEVNDIFIYQLAESKVHNIVNIIKSYNSPFYRDIVLKSDFSTLTEQYFLIEPSTMPNKNTIDSILSWATYSGNMKHTLSQEDREKYPWLNLNIILRYKKDYSGLFSEM